MHRICPACKKTKIMHIPSVYFNRYPYMVCNNCTLRTRTKDGRRIWFANANKGFIGYLEDFNLDNHSTCYVDKIPCYARETRFGGIIISVDMNHRKNMHKWIILSKIIGKLQLIYWTSVIRTNSPNSKFIRGEFVIN